MENGLELTRLKTRVLTRGCPTFAHPLTIVENGRAGSDLAGVESHSEFELHYTRRRSRLGHFRTDTTEQHPKSHLRHMEIGMSTS